MIRLWSIRSVERDHAIFRKKTMKIDFIQLKLITTTNFKLFNRAGMIRNTGYIIDIFIVIIYAVFGLLFLVELGEEDYGILSSLILFTISAMHIAISLFSLTSRYGDVSRSILPRHLSKFPFSRRRIYFYLIWDMLVNINTVAFFLLSLIVAWTMPAPSVFSIALFLMTGLLITVFTSIWTSNLLIFFARIFSKYRNLVAMIPFLMLMSLNLFLNFGDSNPKVTDPNAQPVLGWMGKSLLALRDGDWMQSIIIVILLIVISLAGIVLGLLAFRKQKHVLYL